MPLGRPPVVPPVNDRYCGMVSVATKLAARSRMSALGVMGMRARSSQVKRSGSSPIREKTSA